MTRPPNVLRAICAVAFAGLLTACGKPGDLDHAGAGVAVPDFASARIKPPPGAPPGSCWVRDVAPAELETVTRQVEVAPERIAPDGTILSPARFRTEIAQAIVQERQQLVFETPCPDALTPELISTLQRALDARGLYRGSVNGQMDAPTLRAVRRYQSANGLQSGLLSIQSARGLGLLATPRDQL